MEDGLGEFFNVIVLLSISDGFHTYLDIVQLRGHILVEQLLNLNQFSFNIQGKGFTSILRMNLLLDGGSYQITY